MAELIRTAENTCPTCLALLPLLHTLRERFDARLIDEVHTHGGIPRLPRTEVDLRDAIAVVLEAAGEL